MEPEDYKAKSDMFYSDYWFDGSEEPNYELLREYFKLRTEARRNRIDMSVSWGDLLRHGIERLKLNGSPNPHEAMDEDEMVSINDYITMMGG